MPECLPCQGFRRLVDQCEGRWSGLCKHVPTGLTGFPLVVHYQSVVRSRQYRGCCTELLREVQQLADTCKADTLPAIEKQTEAWQMLTVITDCHV